MPDEDKKRAAHRALVDRVLHGEGRASAEQRASAFSNDDLPPPLHALIDKVATRAGQVTDADFAAAKASGFSEDQLFELVICAALGQSARLMAAFVSKVNESAFNTTDRLADAFGFELLSPEGYEAGAKYLLKRGYR